MSDPAAVLNVRLGFAIRDSRNRNQEKSEKVQLFLTNCICDEMRSYEDELAQKEAEIACRSDEENWNGDSLMITVHQ